MYFISVQAYPADDHGMHKFKQPTILTSDCSMIYMKV